MSLSEPSFMEIKLLIMTHFKIITTTINFIKQTQRFQQALYRANKNRICNLTL